MSGASKGNKHAPFFPAQRKITLSRLTEKGSSGPSQRGQRAGSSSQDASALLSLRIQASSEGGEARRFREEGSEAAVESEVPTKAVTLLFLCLCILFLFY